MKIIDAIRNGTPENPPFGYGDNVAVIDGGEQLFLGPCSTEPNAYRHRDKKPWIDVFARLAPGKYRVRCVVTPVHGKCLEIERRGPVPTTNPNSNHAGKYYADGVLWHGGDSKTNRGSMCCQTIPPDAWPEFIGLWEIGKRASTF